VAQCIENMQTFVFSSLPFSGKLSVVDLSLEKKFTPSLMPLIFKRHPPLIGNDFGHWIHIHIWTVDVDVDMEYRIHIQTSNTYMEYRLRLQLWR